jgi:Rrf2 family protein
MISIRRETDYAARIVLHLAIMGNDARITAEEVAQHRLMPKAFARRIIGRLGAAGILRTIRGAGGGVTLSRPAAQISLLDVVSAMEGSPALNPCVEDTLACPLTSECPVRTSWTKVTERFIEDLRSIHFDYLANASKNSVQSGHQKSPGVKTHKSRTKKKGDGRGRA